MSDKPQIEIVVAHSLVEANGKTIRENNLEKRHRLREGQQVRVYTCDSEDDPPGTLDHVHTDRCQSHVAFILWCGRDCDGEPLYWLGGQAAWHEMEVLGHARTFDSMLWRILNNTQGGYGESSLAPSDIVSDLRDAFNI